MVKFSKPQEHPTAISNEALPYSSVLYASQHGICPFFPGYSSKKRSSAETDLSMPSRTVTYSRRKEISFVVTEYNIAETE